MFFFVKADTGSFAKECVTFCCVVLVRFFVVSHEDSRLDDYFIMCLD